MDTPSDRRLSARRLGAIAALAAAVALISYHHRPPTTASHPGTSGAVTHVDAVRPAAVAAASAASAPRSVRPRCVRNPDAYAFQIVYGYPRDRGSRVGAVGASIRAAVAAANGYIVAAAKAGSPHWDVRLRVRCNDEGRPTIRTFALSKSGADASGETFPQMMAAARAAGLDDPRTKYVVFWDSPVTGMCGQGEMYRDTRRTADNRNNQGNTFAGLFGSGCWDGETAMHEMGHTMGAVQDGAPHATGSSHCNQEQDVMCYADGGTSGRRSDLVTACRTQVFDCRQDDYFRVGPSSGYLATHWNVGWSGNRFLSFFRQP